MSASNSNVLALLASANGVVTLGLEVAGQVIPLGKWLVAEFKQIANDKGTMTYQAVLSADAAELDAIRQMATDDLDAINAELTRLGAPTLAVPPVPPPSVPEG